MAKEEGGERRRIGAAPLLSIIGVVVILVVGGIVWFQGQADAAYRLRADTLLPTQLTVRPGDVECPDGNGASPVPVVQTGTLADALPVYDGDLILVRVRVLPDESSDGSIRFTATWPEAVVGDVGPTCVFVVGEDVGATTVDWEPVDGGIDVSVSDPPVNETTEVEIWLVADDPVPGSTFRTTITPDDSGDDIVIDPLGGRVTIDRRPGSPAVISVVARPTDVDRTFEVVATVTNATPRTRSLDVLLRLETDDGATWSIASSTTDSDVCETGVGVECSLGDLAAGEVVQIGATFQHGADWSPAAVACDGPPSDLGFGLCVEGVAVSVADPTAAPASASALVALPQPQTSGLTIGTDPDPVIARAGQPTEFSFTLETASDDLGSINVIGSDCDELGRELNEPLEDGDAFLETDETWLYGCRVDLEESTTFRIDVAAVDAGGRPVSTSYETAIRVINPQLDLSRGGADGSVLVTNSGAGTIRGVALSVPACESLSVAEGQTTLLEEGDAVEFRCTTSIELAGTVAYGTDELGLGVVGSFGS